MQILQYAVNSLKISMLRSNLQYLFKKSSSATTFRAVYALYFYKFDENTLFIAS